MESIPESQSGTVEMSSLTVKIDERYVLESLSMNFGITVKPSLKFAVNLEDIKGVLDVKDCRMLMELKNYFETSLLARNLLLILSNLPLIID